MYERVGSIITQRTHREVGSSGSTPILNPALVTEPSPVLDLASSSLGLQADLRQESFVAHESYATEREMVAMRQHRVKFVEVDISALSDECFNLRRQIGGYQVRSRPGRPL